ncbi:MAG TPA: GntR family transcriptional regulator [bacterium]|nr:GntR family transcriptional regulator [bacterium]
MTVDDVTIGRSGRGRCRRPTLPRPTAVALAHLQLRQSILAERLRPGEWLRQEELASRLSMSRQPIREALCLLGEEGLVELVPHRGARVAPLSLEELEEIYGARMGLEGLVARYAAVRIDPQVLEALRPALPKLMALSIAGDVDSYLQEDRRFVETCYAVSGRPRLCGQIVALRERAERYLRLVFKCGTGFQWVDYSYRLFQACVAHDADAAEAAAQGALRWTLTQATALFETSGTVNPEGTRALRGG